VADPLSRAPWHRPEPASDAEPSVSTVDEGHFDLSSRSDEGLFDPESKRRLRTWRYPGNPDEGDATFHGSIDADEFAKLCDAADNILDDFPVEHLIISNLTAALRGGRRRRQPGPRRVVRSETPFPLFFKEWDYSSDRVFGPIWSKLKNGEVVEGFSLTPQRLVFRHSTGAKYCVPSDLVRPVLECYHAHGHPGAPKLLSSVKRRHYFSISESDVLRECVSVCQHCPIYQAVKQRHGKAPSSLDFFPIPEDVFSSSCMNFLELEPCTGSDGKEYNYVLVIVCRLRGYIVAIPCAKRV